MNIKEYAQRVINECEIYEDHEWNNHRIDEPDFYCEFKSFGYTKREDSTGSATDIITDIEIVCAGNESKEDFTNELQQEINKHKK